MSLINYFTLLYIGQKKPTAIKWCVHYHYSTMGCRTSIKRPAVNNCTSHLVEGEPSGCLVYKLDVRGCTVTLCWSLPCALPLLRENNS